MTNGKKMKVQVQVQEFRPADLPRIIATAATPPGHPDIEDLKNMAMDTLNGVAGFTATPEQKAAARQTLLDIETERKTR